MDGGIITTPRLSFSSQTHPPSIFTRYASLVKSDGSRPRVFTGRDARPPIERSSRRWGADTPRSKVSGSCEKIDILVKKVAKDALAEVAELKKVDAAVASASGDRLAAARAAAALKRQSTLRLFSKHR